MKLQVIQDVNVALNGERVLADEEVLVSGKARHGVAGAYALEVAGPNPDDGAGEAAARLRVPTGPKWRVQGDAVMSDVDGVNRWVHGL